MSHHLQDDRAMDPRRWVEHASGIPERRQPMDLITSDPVILFLAAVVVPLVIFGLLASRFGSDSRDLQVDSAHPTPWSW
jgi:hypothetical protein